MNENLRTPSGKPGRTIPPLVWIVVAVLLAWAVWWFVQGDGSRETPSGLASVPSSADPGEVQAPYVPEPAIQDRPQVTADEARPDTAREAFEAGVDPAEANRGAAPTPASPDRAPQGPGAR